MTIRYPQPVVLDELTRLERLAWSVTRGLGFVAFVIAVLFGIGLLSQPVMANPSFADRNDPVRLLADRFAEAPIAMGLTDRAH